MSFYKTSFYSKFELKRILPEAIPGFKTIGRTDIYAIYLFVVGIRMILYITYHTYMHACLMIEIAAAKAPTITDSSGFLFSRFTLQAVILSKLLVSGQK